ncbi:MAG: phage portal protein [Provencibacterium sp.]|jgi:SPP1 family phage portal protein|nr:phage portal protein [Provencibacterium sp.]
MKTYQDLEAIGLSEKDRMDFIRSVVNEHRTSADYRTAEDAELYYAKRNPTINKAQKYVYEEDGTKVPDIWSSNYKLTHGFFRRFVLQQVQYILSNGVTFQQEETKKKLGANFDNRLQELCKKAMIDGVAFGFWNLDHLEVFPFADTPKSPGFSPVYDRDSGLLRAGVRYWSTGVDERDKTERLTLYEETGYTDYIQRKGKEMEPMGPRKTYSVTTKANGLGVVESVVGENYPGFPIIPLWANDLKESEIIGIRPSIDCYDFISSDLAGDISDSNGFFWTLNNAQGMDDVDLVKFVKKMNVVRAAALGRDVTAEAHTLAIPVDAAMRMLELLRSDMYQDFMLLDIEKALAGDKTATSIRMAYQQQDDKCGDFEFCIRDFIARLLALLGIEDEPSFQWNRIANQMEETQMVMMAAAELDSETILNKLPWITPEEAEEILKRRAAEDLGRFDGNNPQDGGEGPNEEHSSEK